MDDKNLKFPANSHTDVGDSARGTFDVVNKEAVHDDVVTQEVSLSDESDDERKLVIDTNNNSSSPASAKSSLSKSPATHRCTNSSNNNSNLEPHTEIKLVPSTEIQSGPEPGIIKQVKEINGIIATHVAEQEHVALGGDNTVSARASPVTSQEQPLDLSVKRDMDYSLWHGRYCHSAPPGSDHTSYLTATSTLRPFTAPPTCSLPNLGAAPLGYPYRHSTSSYSYTRPLPSTAYKAMCKDSHTTYASVMTYTGSQDSNSKIGASAQFHSRPLSIFANQNTSHFNPFPTPTLTPSPHTLPSHTIYPHSQPPQMPGLGMLYTPPSSPRALWQHAPVSENGRAMSQHWIQGQHKDDVTSPSRPLYDDISPVRNMQGSTERAHCGSNKFIRPWESPLRGNLASFTNSRYHPYMPVNQAIASDMAKVPVTPKPVVIEPLTSCQNNMSSSMQPCNTSSNLNPDMSPYQPYRYAPTTCLASTVPAANPSTHSVSGLCTASSLAGSDTSRGVQNMLHSVLLANAAIQRIMASTTKDGLNCDWPTPAPRTSRALNGLAAELLNKWFHLNRAHPYPSKSDVQELARLGNITDAQALLIYFVTDILQRAHAVQVRSLAEEGSGREEHVPLYDIDAHEDTWHDIEDEHEDSDSVMAGHIILTRETPVQPPNLHLLGQLFLCVGVRQCFDLLIIVQFMALLTSYALAGPQAYGQILHIDPLYVIPVFVWTLTLFIVFALRCIQPVVSLLTFLKGALIIATVVATFFVGAAVKHEVRSDFSYVGAPLLMGTVALGGIMNVMPFLYTRVEPCRAQVLGFRRSVLAGLATCALLNVLWCWAVLDIVPQTNTCFSYTQLHNNSLHTLDMDEEQREQRVCALNLSLASSAANGEISTLPLTKIISELYPAYDWVALLVQLFILISITVSYLTLGAAMHHTLTGCVTSWIREREEHTYKKHGAEDRGRCCNVNKVVGVLLSLTAFTLVFTIAMLNPKGFVQMLDRVASLFLNLEAGVFFFIIALRARTAHNSSLLIPAPLSGWQQQLVYLLPLYFCACVAYDLFASTYELLYHTPQMPWEHASTPLGMLVPAGLGALGGELNVTTVSWRNHSAVDL